MLTLPGPRLKPMDRCVVVSVALKSTYPSPLSMVCTDTAPASAQPLQPDVFCNVVPVTVAFTTLVQITASAVVVEALLTVTVTAADVVVLPAASRATAV